MNLSHREKIKELFDLSMRILEETNAYVAFEISSISYVCRIYVMDNGWSEDAGYDGIYFIHTEDIGDFEKECGKAIEHLKRLLTDSRIRKEIA